MKVTALQRKYLKAIEATPKTTNEVAEIIGSTQRASWKMLDRLRRKGLAKRSTAERIGTYVLKPGTDIDTLGEKPGYRNGGNAISDEEKAFAAELRESGLVGQRLITKYHERYPTRSRSGISNVIEVIRREGVR